MHEKFNVSQVAIVIRNYKCLIVEFTATPGSLFVNETGLWGLPGGRLDEGEAQEAGFRREIKEELGWNTFETVDVVDADMWYAKSGLAIAGVAYLIKNDSDEPVLDAKEHSSFAWVTEDELKNYTFVWPNAVRMLKKGFARARV